MHGKPNLIAIVSNDFYRCFDFCRPHVDVFQTHAGGRNGAGFHATIVLNAQDEILTLIAVSTIKLVS